MSCRAHYRANVIYSFRSKVSFDIWPFPEPLSHSILEGALSAIPVCVVTRGSPPARPFINPVYRQKQREYAKEYYRRWRSQDPVYRQKEREYAKIYRKAMGFQYIKGE
ncbi:MAG: hypothetical protein WAM14_10815 [Candidatus Nitrosopolaris sp.]